MQQTVSQSSRPRQCPKCDRILYSGPGFRYHLSTHHAAKESFTCELCRKKFKSFNGLKYHQKRKRCKGLTMDPGGAASSTLSASATAGPPLHMPARTAYEEEFHGQRLMELAKIATSPQSPLLQSPGPDSRGGETGTFFDYSEASAAMTLSSMDSKSKRPMNGFMLYAQQHRAELKKKYPNTNNRLISTKLSEEWAQLPDGVRQQWKDKAKVKAAQQLREHPDCWKRKK
ncbi:HMG-box transcription factor 1 [Elysia marginata]|uniref:HMG-box transcription factor 1 n=1 Tax=Elysia marginata TaxID=1093978 RepID=A0AAV4FAA0_9GAST|nr:HMG-box transcription factor 1 [Elysia marginata]